jgi:hypothetical protein
MNIFWFIAIGMAGFIAVIMFTGEIRIKGRLWADRRIKPKYFWLCVGAFAVGLIASVMQAISPPY